VRIIAGEWRGRLLETPPGIRPMQDRERERLFGVLGGRVEDAAFLDVFAGSGAIGLEALSRGARTATLVENGRRVLPVLKRNIESLGAAPRARLLPISAFGLHKAGQPGQHAVDIAVCAPPFPLLEDEALKPRFTALFGYIARRLLRPGGLFVLEHPKRIDAPDLDGVGAPKDRRVTAASALSFYDAPDSGRSPS
jgi:16S rRNA (guanine(966)-N(2))-methyltransferase RsmD